MSNLFVSLVKFEVESNADPLPLFGTARYVHKTSTKRESHAVT